MRMGHMDGSAALDFSSGKFKPHVGLCADSTEPAWNSLSLSLFPSPTHALSLSLSQRTQECSLAKKTKADYDVD